MKSLFDGIKKAKIRTTLNAVLAFIITASICVMAFSFSSDMQRNMNTFSPEFSSGTFDESTEDSNDLENTSVDEETTSEEDSTNQSGEFIGPGRDMQNNMRRGGNITFVILFVVIIVSLAVFFAINFVSTKKKNVMFSDMLERGVSLSAIRKELFKEAFVVILVFGILGSILGAVVARPISNTMSNDKGIELIDDFDESERIPANGDFDGEMPSAPNSDSDSESESALPGFNNDDRGDMPNRGGRGDFNGNVQQTPSNQVDAVQYIMLFALGILYALVAAAIGGVSCFLPVNKKKTNIYRDGEQS